MGQAIGRPVDIQRFARPSPWKWGAAGQLCTAFPCWGERIYLNNIGIQRSCLPEFELNLRVPRHVAEYCINDFDADFALDSDQRTSVRFAAGAAGFAPKGASLFRASTLRPHQPRLHKFIGISFDTDVIDSLFGDIIDTAAIDFATAPTPMINHPMRVIGAQINAAFELPGSIAAITLEALTHQYIMQTLLRWSSVGRNVRRPGCGGKHPGIARCIDYIHANVASAIRLADLAVIADMGIDSLTRHFRQATNRTPHDYIVGQRVALACKLLRHDHQLPLDMVARQAGFSSQSHMTTAFRRQIGQTPGHWLKQATR